MSSSPGPISHCLADDTGVRVEAQLSAQLGGRVTAVHCISGLLSDGADLCLCLSVTLLRRGGGRAVAAGDADGGQRNREEGHPSACARASADQQGNGDNGSHPCRPEQPSGHLAAISRGIDITVRRFCRDFQRGIDAWNRGLKCVGEIQEFLVGCAGGHGRSVWNGRPVGPKLGESGFGALQRCLRLRPRCHALRYRPRASAVARRSPPEAALPPDPSASAPAAGPASGPPPGRRAAQEHRPPQRARAVCRQAPHGVP